MPLDPRLDSLRRNHNALDDKCDPPSVRRQRISERGNTWRHLVTSTGPALLRLEDRVVITECGPVSLRLYRPRQGRLPCLLYIHGGGFWTGSAAESDGTCARLAVAADCVVVSVDYRLAPEHPYPSALDDCYGAATWLEQYGDEVGIDGRLVISGRSSGANLATAVTLLARDRQRPRFLAQLLDVPLVDCTMSHPSITQLSTGYFLTREDLAESIRFYLGDRDANDPLVSPLRSDLRGLPPALVLTAEFDPLRDEGEAYATKLAWAQVPVVHYRFTGITHAAADYDVLLPDVARAYLATVGGYLRSAFAGEVSSLWKGEGTDVVSARIGGNHGDKC